MNSETVRKKLFESQDLEYKKFSEKLIPNISKDRIIGVRSPIIRQIVKEIIKDNIIEYLQSPLTEYHEEKIIFGSVISTGKLQLKQKFAYYDEWLKYADSWAVTDMSIMGVKDFMKKENKEEVFDYWVKKLDSDEIYVKRSAIIVLFRYFLNEEYIDRVIQIYGNVKIGDYYVDMALAWGVCEILIKYYDKGIVLLNDISDKFVHNKAIQKAVESYRLTDGQKNYLRTLKYTK